MDLGEAFLPKFLLRALDLKLSASASSYFLEALCIERDFCDTKTFWTRCFSEPMNHCFILPTTCTAQVWPITTSQQLCLDSS